MKRYFAAMLVFALVSCGGSGPPHSDYYVVTFEPGDAVLPSSGHAALSYATRDADRGAPRAVIIKALTQADAGGSALSDERMKVIADALIEAGVPRAIIQLAPRAVGAAEFARLGNGVVVQVERGEKVTPLAPLDEEPLSPKLPGSPQD